MAIPISDPFPQRWLNLFVSLMILASSSVVGQHEDVAIDPRGKITTTTGGETGGPISEKLKKKVATAPSAPTVHQGVDESFPMHHQFQSDDDHVIGDGTTFLKYQQYIDGCTKQAEHCYQHESDRIEMNLQQPPAMTNYTYAGYAKVVAPPNIKKMLSSLWHTHKDEAQIELWDPSNTYVNHWKVPTKMLDINQYLTENQLQQIVKAAQTTLEAWTQQSLQLTSIYGIRSYYQGAILAPHVDRLPLVSSCIIHVASSDYDDEDGDGGVRTRGNPWILEVIDHSGQAHNVTMTPGDMVLYESHSIIHGRPYPLESDYYANIFLHFEPIGYTMHHAEKGAYGTDGVEIPENKAKVAYERALEKAQKRHAIQLEEEKKLEAEKKKKEEEARQLQAKLAQEKRKQQAAEVVLDKATFDHGTDLYKYKDDAFFHTDNFDHVDGHHSQNVWTGTPGLEIKLGKTADPPLRGLSAAWEYAFHLPKGVATLKIVFDFQLSISPELLTDEYGQCVVALDGKPTVIASITGTATPSQPSTKGARTVHTQSGQTHMWYDVPAGKHTISIGAYNNKKTYDDEFIKLQIDNAIVSSNKYRVPSTEEERKASPASSSSSTTDTDPTGPPSTMPELPHYVSPTLATQWKQQFEYERNQAISPKPTRQALGLLTPHLAAADGLLDVLKEIALKDRNLLFKGDSNGWRPLHEAARSGHTEVVEYLLKEGAQVNERTNHGKGGNALWWAEKKQTKQHKQTAAILKKYGGVKLAPKGKKD